MKDKGNMKQTLIGILMAILFGAGNLVAQTQVKPETVVANLYQAAKTTNVADMSKTQLQKYFNKQLADAIWKVTNDENGIDFDILYNAQNDTQIKSFKIGKAVEFTRTSVFVSVSFTNFGKKEKFEFALGSYAEEWRVTEITYTDGSILTEILN